MEILEINPSFPSKVLVFSIGKYRRENIYEETRKYWKIAKKYQNVFEYGYAVGLKKGYSESAYNLTKWDITSNIEYDGRYEFTGEEFNDFKGFSWKKQIKTAGGYWNFAGFLVVEFDGNNEIIEGKRPVLPPETLFS